MSDEVPGQEREPRPAASDDAARIWQYPLDLTSALVIEPNPSGPGFVCRPERTFAAATPAWGLSQDDLEAARSLVDARVGSRSGDRPGTEPDRTGGAPTTTESVEPVPADLPEAASEEGIAEAFVDLLRHEVIPPVPGFRVVRLVPPPEARGERPIHENGASSVVVGERVVVTWVRDVVDMVHEAPTTLAHLDAVEHFEVPETHGMLLWTTPGGHEVPVAWATKYLPRARDGWDWCIDLTQRALGVEPEGAPPPSAASSTASTGIPIDTWVSDFPARLGRTAAKLHLALATSSSVLPEPVSVAPPDLIRAWRSAALERLAAAEQLAHEGTLEGVADVLLPRLPALRAAIDRIEEVAEDAEGEPDGDSGRTPTRVSIQRIHGDLHVGQILRWPGGLVVVDFHPNPVIEVAGLTVGQAMAPTARDVARLLRSLDHVARVVDKGTGFTMTPQVDAWSRRSREMLLEAYRGELAAVGREDLLDERLIEPFEAEQLCHEIVYAAQYVPSWVYAPLGGLWQSYEALGEGAEEIDLRAAEGADGTEAASGRRRRGRRARPADPSG